MALSLCSLGGGDAFKGWSTGESEKEDKRKRQRRSGWDRVRSIVSPLFSLFCSGAHVVLSKFSTNFKFSTSLVHHFFLSFSFFLSFFICFTLLLLLLIRGSVTSYTGILIYLGHAVNRTSSSLLRQQLCSPKNNVSKNTTNNMNTVVAKYGPLSVSQFDVVSM